MYIAAILCVDTELTDEATDSPKQTKYANVQDVDKHSNKCSRCPSSGGVDGANVQTATLVVRIQLMITGI